MAKVKFTRLLTVDDHNDKPFMFTHALFESASGYAIFEAKLVEDIGSQSAAFQDSIRDLSKFGKMVTLKSFSPFKSAAQALENANDVSEGAASLFLWSTSRLTIARHTKRLPKIAAGIELDESVEEISRGSRSV